MKDYATMQEFYADRISEQNAARNNAFKWAKANGVTFTGDYAEIRITWTDGKTYRCYDYKTKSGDMRKRCKWHVVG